MFCGLETGQFLAGGIAAGIGEAGEGRVARGVFAMLAVFAHIERLVLHVLLLRDVLHRVEIVLPAAVLVSPQFQVPTQCPMPAVAVVDESDALHGIHEHTIVEV